MPGSVGGRNADGRAELHYSGTGKKDPLRTLRGGLLTNQNGG